MVKAKRAAIYLRVSTADQTTANQRPDLEAAAAARGWEVVDIYEDAGISGAKGRQQRPELDRLLKDAVRGRFNAVLVWDASRLARSTAHLATMMGELQALGVTQVFLKEGIDTSTPHGRAMVQMAGVFAELEREMIRERVMAGLARAKRANKRLGRPPVANKVRTDILQAAERGLSVRAIAAKVGASVGTVHRTLAASSATLSL